MIRKIFSVALVMSPGAAAEADSSHVFECHGYSTALYASENTTLAICHGQLGQVKRDKLAQWQGCLDASIYRNDRKAKKREVIADCTASSEKEFRVAEGVLHLRHYYTHDPDFSYSPLLVEKYLMLNQSREYEFLVKLPRHGRQEVLQAVAQLEKTLTQSFDGNTYFSTVYQTFFMLRDYAVQEPDYVLKLFASYADRQLFDGEVAEVLAEIQEQARIIAQAMQKGANP